MTGLFRFGALDGVRWRAVLAAGAVVGILPYLLMYLALYGYMVFLQLSGRYSEPELLRFAAAYGNWGMPALHMLLATLAASWVARRVGTAAVAHGVLIALVSVVFGQVAGLCLNWWYGDLLQLNPIEVSIYLVLALAGGLLGGLESRDKLAGQEAFYRASQSISTASDPRAVASAIGEYLAGGASVAGVALWRAPVGTEDDRPEGLPAARKPWSAGDWPGDVDFDGTSPSVLVDAGGEAPWALRVGDLPDRERVAWRRSGTRSVLLLPLVAPGGTKAGLLAVASRRRRLPKSTVRACLTMGAQAALVLENLRLVEEARHAGRQAGVLRERERMAREIHDTLAQGFTSIVMNLEAAEGTLPPDPSRARHHVDQARTTARESLTEARRLVWALRPEALESAPLPEALGKLAERWSAQSGVAAGITVTGTARRLPQETEAALFRVAQETLNNVRKHARASRAALTLSYMGGLVTLDVRDDGVGFDPLATNAEASARANTGRRDKASGGFGLVGMRERVERVGGSLSIESAPGEGSTLAVVLPVAAPENPVVGDDATSANGDGRPR